MLCFLLVINKIYLSLSILEKLAKRNAKIVENKGIKYIWGRIRGVLLNNAGNRTQNKRKCLKMEGVCVILHKVMNDLVDGGINRGSFEDDFNNSIYYS